MNIITNLTRNYVPDWTVLHAMRELIQTQLIVTLMDLKQAMTLRMVLQLSKQILNYLCLLSTWGRALNVMT